MKIVVRNTNKMDVKSLEEMANEKGCIIEIVGTFKLKDSESRQSVILDLTKTKRDVRNIKAIYIEKIIGKNNTICLALLVKKEK